MKCMFCAFFRGIFAPHKGHVTIPCLSQSLNLINLEKTASNFFTTFDLDNFDFSFLLFFGINENTFEINQRFYKTLITYAYTIYN